MSSLNGDSDPKARYGRFGDPVTPQHARLARDMALLEGQMQQLEEAAGRAAAEGRKARLQQAKPKKATSLRKFFSRILA